MNGELTQRLQKALPPFDGNVLHFLPALASRSQLAHAVAVTTQVLRQHRSTDSIFVLEDWIEHDDYVSSERACDWDQLQAWSRTPDSLAASGSGDWRVHTLVYTEDLSACFRYWVDVDEDCDHGFDVCASETTLDEIAEALTANDVGKPAVRNAKEYFMERRA